MAACMKLTTRPRFARVPRPGGPEVIEIAFDDLPALDDGQVRVRVEAVGLNHAETLIRSGNYAVRMPFPSPAGGEGSGTVVETTPAANLPIGGWVCWGGINYGELSGPVPGIDLYRLFPKSVFVTKYNGTQWFHGLGELGELISRALGLAVKRPALISPVAGRFRLEDAVDAYRLLETNPPGKVLVDSGRR